MSKPQMKKSREPVTPMKIINDLWAARISLTLAAAVDLDIFTAISQGNRTATDIAKTRKVPKRGLERLLDALVGIGYLTKRGVQYGIRPVADTFLVRTKNTFIGAMVDETRITVPSWVQLADVIRSGKPIAAVDTAEGREFFPRLVKAIFPMTYNGARGFVAGLPQAKLKKIERVLDVAAGSGAWSLPFAQAILNARVTALDYPEVTAVTRQYAQQFGVADPTTSKATSARSISDKKNTTS
jgi:hypothetical protein